jgi:hypothetical protein
MTSPDRRVGHPDLLDIIAAFFAGHPEPSPDLLVIGPCDRAAEPEPEMEIGR